MGVSDASIRRSKSDFFVTPEACIQALLDNTEIDKNALILDPCCGDGIIKEILIKNNYYNIVEYDIEMGINFLDDNHRYDVIIANPPYSDKYRFMDHAFRLADHIFMIFPMTMASYNIIIKDYLSVHNYNGRWIMSPKFFMKPERQVKPQRGGDSAYAWFYWQGINGSKLHCNNVSFEKYINLNKYKGFG